MKEAVIGIDIGGTYTKFGIVDREGNSYGEGSIPSDTTDDINEYLHELHYSVKELISCISLPLDVKGIGIGVPNGNYLNGTIEFAPNLRWKGMIYLADLFHKQFKLPSVLTNDAKAAALGEMIYGGAKNMKDFIVITLGTGLGSGIVVNGEVVYGHDGFAGEIGHTIVKLNGRECGCGRRGCLETYVSASGIKRTVYKFLSDSIAKSELRQYSFEELTSEMISEAALRGDKIAIQVFEYTAEILATKLADAVAHTSPEAIFIFGGLAKAGDLLLKPLRKNIETKLLQVYRNKVKILLSSLMDKNAAVLGAGALMWKEMDKAIRK